MNLALQGVISQCVVGAKVLEICEFGHTIIDAQAQKIYQKKVNGRSIDRGVAFPVCISVNDVVCNYSPLKTDETVSRFLFVIVVCGPTNLCGRTKCVTIAGRVKTSTP